MNCEYAGILKWLFDWQTLITGVLAVTAAWIAARPVWRQLKLSARDMLDVRVSAMELKRDTTNQIMAGVGRFMSQLRPYGDDHEHELNPQPEWASDAESTVRSVIATLTTQQETSLDGELIDSRRRAVIQECEALSGCLFDIHAPYSIDFGDYEAPSEEERPAFIKRGKRAEKELETRISATMKATNALGDAFSARLKQLREQIRKIDNLLIR